MARQTQHESIGVQAHAASCRWGLRKRDTRVRLPAPESHLQRYPAISTVHVPHGKLGEVDHEKLTGWLPFSPCSWTADMSGGEGTCKNVPALTYSRWTCVG